MDELLYSVIFAGMGMAIVFGVLLIYSAVMMLIPRLFRPERERGREKKPDALARGPRKTEEDGDELTMAAAAAVAWYIHERKKGEVGQIILFTESPDGAGRWKDGG